MDENHHEDAEDVKGQNTEGSAPLADIAAKVAARTAREEDTEQSAHFEEQPYQELDEEVVWTDGQVGESAPGGLTADISRQPDGTVIVPKREFCEACPHFEDPPQVDCRHEAATIHEFVDFHHVRVGDCPVVRNLIDGDG